MDGVDPRQNIGFENKGNIGDIGILGGKYRILICLRKNKEVFFEIVFLIAE